MKKKTLRLKNKSSTYFFVDKHKKLTETVSLEEKNKQKTKKQANKFNDEDEITFFPSFNNTWLQLTGLIEKAKNS